MDNIIQDLRLALRQLAQRRTFAAVVLATLALGIGATSTFFSVLNGVALRPLPFRDRRQQGLVLGALGLVAVLVAALGVYGVMSLIVAERRREIAIRSALGGTRTAIVRLILGNAMRVVSAGIGAGFVLAFAVTSFLASIFFGLRAFDPRVFVAAAGLLAGVALLSSWWPAREAARVDPIAALKN